MQYENAAITQRSSRRDQPIQRHYDFGRCATFFLEIIEIVSITPHHPDNLKFYTGFSFS